MKETYTLTVERKEENGVPLARVTLSYEENTVIVVDSVEGEDLKNSAIARCVGGVFYTLQMARAAKEHGVEHVSQILAAGGVPAAGTSVMDAYDAFVKAMA